MPDRMAFGKKLIADDPNISDADLESALKVYDQQHAAPTRPVSAEDFAPKTEGTGFFGALKAFGSALDPRPLASLAAQTVLASQGDPTAVGRTGLRIAKQVVGQQGQQFAKAGERGMEALRQAGSGNFQAAGQAGNEAAGRALAGLVPVLGPAAAKAGERIGSGDIAGGVGESAALLAPFAAGPVARGVSNVGKSAAGNLYLRALKPTKAVLEDAPAFRSGGQFGAKSELARTGLEARAPVGGASGIEKVQGGIEDLNQKIAARIAQADMQGRFVDPIQVAKRAQEIKAKFANQVNPQSDLAAIDQAIADFMAHPKFGASGGAASLLSPSDAQSMKQGTYRVLGGRAYGETGTASGEAQKALGRGLKEEIAGVAPEVSPMNLKESRLINLEDALQNRARTAGNADPLKLGEMVLGAGKNPARSLFGLVNRPAILSRGAIGINDISSALGAASPTLKSALMALLSGQQSQ